MSTKTGPPPGFTPSVGPAARLEQLYDDLAELCGQRNAIDGKIVDIVAEIDRDHLLGAAPGVRSVAGLVAWRTGVSPANAGAIAAVAHRADGFPRLTEGLRDGRLSLDQVAVIAQGAADGSDDHYAELAPYASVTQLRTAVRLEPRPDTSKPDRRPEIRKSSGDEFDFWRITLPHTESAKLEAALASHRDALIAAWKTAHPDADPNPGIGIGIFAEEVISHHSADDDDVPAGRPPMPTALDAFLRLVEAGWDAEATARPHGQRTTVVVHVDLDARIAALHLGPLLPDAERRYLTCDATCEVWFERDGAPIGAGRSTRTISRRLRRALEHRDKCCVVPGCGATRGLHAHHVTHWEDGGPTELGNLVLLCPYHHRLHHKGLLNITGPAGRLRITDPDGHELRHGSLARPPSKPPPNVPRHRNTRGGRAQWRWYTPFEPQPPPEN